MILSSTRPLRETEAVVDELDALVFENIQHAVDGGCVARCYRAAGCGRGIGAQQN